MWRRNAITHHLLLPSSADLGPDRNKVSFTCSHMACCWPCRHFWIWDFESPDAWLQPAATATDGAALAGTAVLALCRAVAEAVAQAAAAGWHRGMQSTARFGMMPLAAGGNNTPATGLQQQVRARIIWVDDAACLPLAVLRPASLYPTVVSTWSQKYFF